MKPNHKCGDFDADSLLYLSGKLDEDQLSIETRKIKRQLRSVMNGVASSSMQERGANYKVNYGVPFVILKQMAKSIPQNHELAQLWWTESVRELNILATFIQPVEHFTEQTARKWIQRIKTVEQSEQFCMNLLQHAPYALTLAVELLQSSKDETTRLTAWILLARIAKKKELDQKQFDTMLDQATIDLSHESYALMNAAILALKKIGSANESFSHAILERVSEISFSGVVKKEQIEADLRFEFDYYRHSAL